MGERYKMHLLQRTHGKKDGIAILLSHAISPAIDEKSVVLLEGESRVALFVHANVDGSYVNCTMLQSEIY